MVRKACYMITGPAASANIYLPISLAFSTWNLYVMKAKYGCMNLMKLEIYNSNWFLGLNKSSIHLKLQNRHKDVFHQIKMSSYGTTAQMAKTYPYLPFPLMLYLIGLPICLLPRNAPLTILSINDFSSLPDIDSSSKFIFIYKIYQPPI